MIKIIVDSMPEKSEDCPFAEYINMTSKRKCMFKQGLYSRCNLECEFGCCRYLTVKGESND